MTKTEFKKLQKENEKIRERIDKTFEVIFGKERKEEFWILINSLIENELQQEQLCGE